MSLAGHSNWGGRTRKGTENRRGYEMGVVWEESSNVHAEKLTTEDEKAETLRHDIRILLGRQYREELKLTVNANVSKKDTWNKENTIFFRYNA